MSSFRKPRRSTLGIKRPGLSVKGVVLATLAAILATTGAFAAAAVEQFEIEGLISPASPKALTAGLEERLDVKVVGLKLKETESGWPVLSVEFDPAKHSREELEQTIGAIEDPAGHKYRVHKGPAVFNAAYTEEEMKAITALGPPPPDIPAVTNPVESSDESLAQGKDLYMKYCTTCHGRNGSGAGPAAHGITTTPPPLWRWHGTDSSSDGYLYWFITNGRNEMPPWGVLLSENERWDVINYIKTIEAPQ